ncbi:MAG: substrate-binding domain-containing protein [Planctomycetes bacterium]|nr:substrate-binding domain-containing protein [Planctomycetota bacterium]
MARQKESWLYWALVLGIVVGAVAWSRLRQRRPVVVVYTSVEERVAAPAFLAFAQKSGVQVRPVYGQAQGRRGVANRLLAEAVNPDADVYWAADSLEAEDLSMGGRLDGYRPAEASTLPEWARGDEWIFAGARAHVLLVHRLRLAGRAEPRSVLELAQPRWKSDVAAAVPLEGLALAHVCALAGKLGDAAAKDLLQRARDNGVLWEKSELDAAAAVADGKVTWALVDVTAAQAAALGKPDLFVVEPDQDADAMGMFLLPTAAAVVRGARHGESAHALVDELTAQASAANARAERLLLPASPPGKATFSASVSELRAARERLLPWLEQWARQ